LLYEPHTKKTFWCAHILHYSWINGLTVLFDFDIYSSAALQRLVSLNHAMLTPFGVSPISKKTFIDARRIFVHVVTSNSFGLLLEIKSLA